MGALLLIPPEDTGSLSRWFALCIILLGLSIALARDKLTYLLSPTAVGTLYLLVSYMFGAMVFANGLEINWMPGAYRVWASSNVFVSYTLLCVVAAVLAYLAAEPQSSNIEARRGRAVMGLDLVLMTALFAASLVGFRLSDNLGTLTLMSLSAVATIYCLSRTHSWLRFPGYLLIIGAIATGTFDSKRVAIFLFLVVICLEWILRERQPSWRKVFVSAVGCLALVFVLVLAMSIARGYGNFGQISFIQALGFIFQYIDSPIFLLGLQRNLELGVVFFSGGNAVDIFSKDPSKLLLGEPYLKALFIGIPEYVFGYKPDSSIGVYTHMVRPAWRDAGGSYPVNIWSEAFMSFHFIGAAICFLLFYVMNKIYFWLIRSVKARAHMAAIFGLFCYYHTLTLVRGAGLDLIGAYIIGAALVLALVIFPLWRIASVTRVATS